MDVEDDLLAVLGTVEKEGEHQGAVAVPGEGRVWGLGLGLGPGLGLWARVRALS